MNKKKAFKILKVVLIVIVSLIVLAVASGVAVYQIVIKPNADEITSAIEDVLKTEEGQQLTDEVVPDDTEDILGEAAEDDELLGEIGDAANEVIGADKAQKNDKTPKKPKSEYKNQYDYIKDNVESSDYKLGMSFVSRVDLKYILSLLKGGLTIPEKRELKAYLKARFTDAEIAEGERLYNKYSHLLK